MRTVFFYLFLGLISLASCLQNDDDAVVDQRPSGDWLIPRGEVRDGGPGKDGIPSVDDPKFVAVQLMNDLPDDELVVGVIEGNQRRAYPHSILDWHEIVNDELGDKSYALTYCPLTGTAVSWNRNVNGSITTFGVSGKLYNSNLMPFDRETDSYWSQLTLNCVNGDLIGTDIETFPIIETTWGTWKKLYPQSEVMTRNTGFNRNYDLFPYGDYRTNNNNIIFSTNPFDRRLPSKERVLGVLNGETNKVYSIELFNTPRVIQDQVGDKSIIVIGSKTDNFIVAFEKGELGAVSVDFSEFPNIAKDDLGNVIDINGQITAGPLSGQQLEQPISIMAYFFSLGAFYPGIEIYE